MKTSLNNSVSKLGWPLSELQAPGRPSRESLIAAPCIHDDEHQKDHDHDKLLDVSKDTAGTEPDEHHHDPRKSIDDAFPPPPQHALVGEDNPLSQLGIDPTPADELGDSNQISYINEPYVPFGESPPGSMSAS
jgi:hypothetical protein